MTYNEFISKLHSTPRDWFLSPEGFIRYPGRRDFGPPCPINRIWPGHSKEQWWSREVVEAVDLKPGFIRSIRRDLMEACGLGIR